MFFDENKREKREKNEENEEEIETFQVEIFEQSS